VDGGHGLCGTSNHTAMTMLVFASHLDQCKGRNRITALNSIMPARIGLEQMRKKP